MLSTLPDLGTAAAACSLVVKVTNKLYGFLPTRQGVPSLFTAVLPEDGSEAPLSLSAQRLLANPQPVLDADKFVTAAAELPASQLRSSLENCLLECTNTRLARPHEQMPSYTVSKINQGVAGLVQQVAAGSTHLQLFPTEDGLPTLSQLLHATVLPPSSTKQLLAAPAVQLFVAHSIAIGSAGRRSAAEQYDRGSAPSLYDRSRRLVRAAARRGGTYYTLLSGMPVWQRFELVAADESPPSQQQQHHHHQPPQGQQVQKAPGSVAHASGSGDSAAAAGGGSKKARQKRKLPAPAAAACRQQRQAGRQGTAPTSGSPATLRQSACSCSHPDLGVLWCVHRCDAAAGLLTDPALHVVDVDALAALLEPLSNRQLAQLLLTVAFAGGTLPDMLLSLQLSPAEQASLFLPSLVSAPLPVPLTSELRLLNYSALDATLGSQYYGGYSPAGPYNSGRETSAASAANPEGPGHLATRLSVISGTSGSVLQAVDRHVQALSPDLVWHLKGMGVDALDLFPESLSPPTPPGTWSMEARQGAGLSFEDALGMVRALSMLGGSYLPVATQLLKDLTVTAAHPHYCNAALPPHARSLFARRLAQLWQQLTTPAERWSLFLEQGMRLPSVWSDCVQEVAWEVVAPFPVLCAMNRQLIAAAGGITRGAATALLTRTSLLPRTTAGAGTSAFADLLLFERNMRRGFVQFAEGLGAFLKQQQQKAQLCPPRDGSLLQLAARSVAQQLLASGRPLAETHATFQDMILDLQGAVLWEGARLVGEAARAELEPGGPLGMAAGGAAGAAAGGAAGAAPAGAAAAGAAAGAPAPAGPAAGAAPAAAAAPALGQGLGGQGMLLPSNLRNAGTLLRTHTVGMLSGMGGQPYNAEGLERNALPPHLPPAISSSPFSWVTMDLQRMLSQPVYLDQSASVSGACWACAYLQLVPKYSPAGVLPIWNWLRSNSILSILLASAASAAAGRNWHHAAMLADAAHKYLASSSSMPPSALAAEQTHLQALRPVLHMLAFGAMAQLRHCLALHASGVLLTHSSSMRACCLLLRSVLSLTAEVLEPVLLRQHAVPADAAGGIAADFLAPQQQQMAQAVALMQQLQWPLNGEPPAPQLLQQVQDMAAQMAAGALQLQQQVALLQAHFPPAAEGPAAAGAAAAGGAGPGQPLGQQATTPAQAAAAVAMGRVPEQLLGQQAAEALAADASMLLQVAQVVLELMAATLDAAPLLPLQNISAAAAASSSATNRRQQQDTALWRGAELFSDPDQHAYMREIMMEDGGGIVKTFPLNEIMMLLGQQLPVALLPLQQPRPAAAAAAAAEPSNQQQPQPQQQPQQAGAAVDAAPGRRVTRGRARSRDAASETAAVAAAGGAPHSQHVAAVEAALLVMLPVINKLSGQLLESCEEGGRRSAHLAVNNRFKHGPLLALVCNVLHLAASSGTACATQLALMPNAWKLMSSYMADVLAALPDRPSSASPLRLYALAAPTLLSMLHACTVTPAAPAPVPAAGAAGGGGAHGEPAGGPVGGAGSGSTLASKQAGREEEEQEQEEQPRSKRRRQSGRPSGGSGGGHPAAGSGPAAAAAAAAAGVVPRDEAGAAAPADDAAAADGDARTGQGSLQLGKLCAGDAPVELSAVQASVQRMLQWLTSATQEQWRASNYVTWRPTQQQQQQQVPLAAALQQVVDHAQQHLQGLDAQFNAQLEAAIAQHQMAGVPPPPPPVPPPPGAQQGPAGAQQAAAGQVGQQAAAGQAAQQQQSLQRPRQAFLPRQAGSSVTDAFSQQWPVSAIQVLHWWVRHRSHLQPPEVCTGPAAVALAEQAAAASSSRSQGPGVLQSADLLPHSYRLAGADYGCAVRIDSREDTFATLEGTVSLASSACQQPKLRLLSGTLITLLCMECAAEVHAAALAALLDVVRQPGAAAELAEGAPFWILHRLLLREELPAVVKQQGQAVVAAVEAALQAEPGNWGTLLRCQQAAAVEAEAQAAERRQAAAAAGAAVGAAGNPLLPPPPPWFAQFDGPFDPFELHQELMQMQMHPHQMLMGMGAVPAGFGPAGMAGPAGFGPAGMAVPAGFGPAGMAVPAGFGPAGMLDGGDFSDDEGLDEDDMDDEGM